MVISVRSIGGRLKFNSGAEGGYSLIEVLISLTVVTLYLASLATIVQNGLDINGRTNQQAAASALAFQKVQDYVNLDFANIPVGDNLTNYLVENFSTEATAEKLANADAKLYVRPASTIQSGSSTTTAYSQTITADASYSAGSEIAVVDVDDATNDYWRITRISDDSYTNYTYNSDDPDPDNKAVPSIDLGSAQLVDTIRIEWWTCTYGADNFRIEAKNSSPNTNSGWTTIVSGLSDNNPTCNASDTNSQDIDVSSNTTPYRYWRMYVVDATHSDWNVISEFEAFSSDVPGDIVEQHGSDASSSPGDLSFSSTTLELAEDGARGHQSLGMIFNDIDVPQGATIDSAYIEFQSNEDQSGVVSLEVQGVDRDNAAAWSGSYAVDNAVDTNAADGSIGTAATTSWTPPAWSSGEKGDDTRVSVTTIVKEIVDRGGWAVDNDMAFAVQYVSGAGKRVARRDGSAPQLVINWSETTTTTATNLYVDLDADGDVDNPTLLRLHAVIEYDGYGSRRRVEYQTFIRQYGITD